MSELTLSDFLRRSGDVLKDVAHTDVVLRRRDGDDVVLTTVPRLRAIEDALEMLSRLVLELHEDPASRSILVRRFPRAVPWSSLLAASEREQLVVQLAETAQASAELAAARPLIRLLDRWRGIARRRTGPPVSAHKTRPVSIPDDVGDPSVEKASGVVELPLRVRWSGPPRTYDLDDVAQLRRVYEQVLREGTDEDVRRFIDVELLIANWNDLVLPSPVRRAWAEWLRDRRGIDVPC